MPYAHSQPFSRYAWWKWNLVEYFNATRMLCRPRRNIFLSNLLSKSNSFSFTDLHFSTEIVSIAMSSIAFVWGGTWVIILSFLLLLVVKSLFSIPDHRTRRTLFFKFSLKIIRLDYETILTYKIDRCVFEAWCLISLPSWLLNKSDAGFLVGKVALQFTFSKFPCLFILVKVTARCWFLLELRLVNDLICHSLPLSREELWSFSDWILGPINLSLVLRWSWHELLLFLSFLSEHTPLSLLLSMCFNRYEVSHWSFWVITMKSEGRNF